MDTRIEIDLTSEEPVEVVVFTSARCVLLHQAPFQGGLRIAFDDLEGFGDRVAALARELRASESRQVP